jgi:hypothetical protein
VNRSHDMKTAEPWKRATSLWGPRRTIVRWSPTARWGSKARAAKHEPDSASLRTKGATLLPEDGWSGTRCEEASKRSIWAPRGGWGQRAPKDQSRNLGDPSSWVEPNAPGNWQAAAAEVGGVRSSAEAG